MNLSRQFQQIQVSCKDIIKEDGIVLNGQFYTKLEEFIKFYDEIKRFLEKAYEKDELLSAKINDLPQIKFKNYDNPFTFKTILHGIYYVFLPPLLLLPFYRKYRYVARTKSSLRDLSDKISSIEFLLKSKV